MVDDTTAVDIANSMLAKYKDPIGTVFDLTHTGWVGAVKDVLPAKS